MNDDLISRQAAIKLAIDLDYESRGILKESRCRDIEIRYNMIPSAQPEWKIYKERYDDLCDYFNNDLKTIKAILWDRKEFKAWLERMHWHVQECNKLSRELEKIRGKQGKWVKVYGYATPGGDPVWKCSECGKGLHVYGVEHRSYGADVSDGQWKACPNCGADMRGKPRLHITESEEDKDGRGR